jgi:hypothetical protein
MSLTAVRLQQRILVAWQPESRMAHLMDYSTDPQKRLMF